MNHKLYTVFQHLLDKIDNIHCCGSTWLSLLAEAPDVELHWQWESSGGFRRKVNCRHDTRSWSLQPCHTHQSPGMASVSALWALGQTSAIDASGGKPQGGSQSSSPYEVMNNIFPWMRIWRHALHAMQRPERSGASWAGQTSGKKLWDR